MRITDQLSSQCGDKTEASNKRVAEQCLKNPSLLHEIVSALDDKDVKLVGDCAEVMTKVAETHPELVAPHADKLIPLFKSKNTRVRWESMHAIAFITHLVPEIVYTILPDLEDILHKDKSVIVRDYATETIVRYAGTSKDAAKNAYPYLLEILKTWSDKHSGRALIGLLNVYHAMPKMKNQIRPIAESYANSKRGVVKKAAVKLLKALEEN